MRISKVVEQTVLIADDDAAIRTVVNQALVRAGFRTRVTSNFNTLWEWISQNEGDCVVCDVVMPGADAFEFIPRGKSLRSDLPIILISAQNTFMTAVNAQEAGAYEYLPKPFDLTELVNAVNRAIQEPKDNRPTQSVQDYSAAMPLVGRSPAMQELYRSIARLTSSDMSVIITGEGGTGKRLTAKVLHQFSTRKQGPFVPVNIAAIPDNQIEGVLFGSMKSDHTSEPGAIQKADGGTLFLDEVSALPPSVQSRLLRLFIEGTVTPIDAVNPIKIDVRIISSTTKDIGNLIETGIFREDLFYRLSVVPIRIPPLRERLGDVSDLARHFVKMAELEGGIPRHLSSGALQKLKEHSWPGNVRELENLINRVCILYPQEVISPVSVVTEIANSAFFRPEEQTSGNVNFEGFRNATDYFLRRYFEEFGKNLPPDGVYHRFLSEFEYPLITNALEATNGNQVRAAALLGMNRNTLRKRIADLGIKIVKTAR